MLCYLLVSLLLFPSPAITPRILDEYTPLTESDRRDTNWRVIRKPRRFHLGSRGGKQRRCAGGEGVRANAAIR